MKKWLILALALFVLTACNNKEESNTESSVNSDKESTVGYEMLGDSIVGAEDIPKEAEKEILAAFDEFVASFNSKDINRYIKTLSKKPQGFDIEEDKEYVQNIFSRYDIERTASDVTIVKYNENEAHVYANLQDKGIEIKTNAEFNDSGRQVTVFIKEDGAWKVTRVAYLGDAVIK